MYAKKYQFMENLCRRQFQYTLSSFEGSNTPRLIDKGPLKYGIHFQTWPRISETEENFHPYRFSSGKRKGGKMLDLTVVNTRG